MTFILLFFPQDSYKHRAKCFVLCNCIESACFVVHVRPLWWCPACKIDLNVVTVAAFRLSFLKNSDKEQLQQFIIVIISRLVIFTRIMIANLCLRLFAVKTRVIFTIWLLVQKYSCFLLCPITMLNLQLKWTGQLTPYVTTGKAKLQKKICLYYTQAIFVVWITISLECLTIFEQFSTFPLAVFNYAI